MRQLVWLMIFFSVAGFIAGLAGKAWSVKKKSVRMNEFYTRLTILFVVLLFLLLIVYQFFNE